MEKRARICKLRPYFTARWMQPPNHRVPARSTLALDARNHSVRLETNYWGLRDVATLQHEQTAIAVTMHETQPCYSPDEWKMPRRAQ